MGQEKPVMVKAPLRADYTLTNAYADVYSVVVGDFSCVAPEDGWYDIKAQVVFQAAAQNDDCQAGIGVEGNILPETYLRVQNIAAGALHIPMSFAADAILLEKDDVVSLRAEYVTAGGKIDYAAGANTGYISIVKR